MSLRNKLEGVRAIWRFDNKWELLLSRTLFRSHPLTVYRYAGMEILVDHGADDPSGLRNVLVSPMMTSTATRASREALCASITPPATSPIA